MDCEMAADTPRRARGTRGFHTRHLQCLVRFKRRQESGQALCEQGLARAGRPDHEPNNAAGRAVPELALSATSGPSTPNESVGKAAIGLRG